MAIIGSLILAYLLGSIPFSLVIGQRVKGIDLREYGSGNLGATNVYRVAGRGLGIATLVGDALKGVLPTLFAAQATGFSPAQVALCLVLDMAKGALAVVLMTVIVIAQPDNQPLPLHLTGDIYRILAGVFAILGHGFSPFASFKGGKGIATTFGVFLILEPLPILIAFGIFLAVFFATRIVSLGSLCAAAVVPLAVLVFELRSPNGFSVTLFVFSVLLSALVIWRHRANIRRLQSGTEKPLTGPAETLDQASQAASQTMREIVEDTAPQEEDRS